MSQHEILSLFVSTGGKIDSLWEFFTSVHIFIFGALFVFHKLTRAQVFISILAYTIFTVINTRAMIHEYTFYESLLADAQNGPSKLGFQRTFETLANYQIGDRIGIAIAVHILAFFMFLYLVFAAKDKESIDD